MSSRTFEDLIAESASVSVDGWDFSWLDGRATEERPSWGYQKLMNARLGTVASALDIQTGGGEVLNGAADFPPTMAATEGWPPNIAKATVLLGPRGVVVVADSEEPPLPFADSAFELVTSRHPVRPWFGEIARVLKPGGTYLAQHVGPASGYEIAEYFLGPQSEETKQSRSAERESAEAVEAGLEIVDIKLERLRMEFHDVGAMVYFLRKVIWFVPDFSVEKYRDRLRELHEQIQAEGPFVAYSSRFLIEARKPAS